MTEPVEIVGLGEVLWDLLPSGKQPGGAPFNFTFHCHQLGHTSAIVSRIVPPVGSRPPVSADGTAILLSGQCAVL